jgi:hypothetical protein
VIRQEEAEPNFRQKDGEQKYGIWNLKFEIWNAGVEPALSCVSADHIAFEWLLQQHEPSSNVVDCSRGVR